MPTNLNDFIRQIQKDNPIQPKQETPKKIILPESMSVQTEDTGTPCKKIPYQPPTRNDFSEKEFAAQIPQGELAEIKKTNLKLKKSKDVVVKVKRKPVDKIMVECSLCEKVEKIYNNIIITPDNPHVCAGCLKKLNQK